MKNEKILEARLELVKAVKELNKEYNQNKNKLFNEYTELAQDCTHKEPDGTTAFKTAFFDNEYTCRFCGVATYKHPPEEGAFWGTWFDNL